MMPREMSIFRTILVRMRQSFMNSSIIESSLNSNWISFSLLHFALQLMPRSADAKWSPTCFDTFAFRFHFNLTYFEIRILGLRFELTVLPAPGEAHFEMAILGPSVLKLFPYPSWPEILSINDLPTLEKIVRREDRRARYEFGMTCSYTESVQVYTLGRRIHDLRNEWLIREMYQ